MSEQNKAPERKQLKSGERHIRSTISKVGKWHKWRYGEALPYLTKKDTVIDIGCGVGYGSFILAKNAGKVVSIDDSQEAINYAKKYWQEENIKYYCKNVFDVKKLYDVTVALEVVEHIRDTDRLFKKFEEITKRILVLSVPHISIPVKNRFHWRHFEKCDVVKYVTDIGFEIIKLETPRFGNGLAVFCIAKRKI